MCRKLINYPECLASAKSHRTTFRNLELPADYDKIFKENLERIILTLAQRFFDITPEQLSEIPDDIQTTIERKPDFLKRVAAKEGKDYILQIEFQSHDDDEMAYRMLEYSAMLIRKYKTDVRQTVVYIGEGKSKMTDRLSYTGHRFMYKLVSLSDYD